MSANKQTYQINGRVLEIKSKRGIAGLRVEAWDKDLIFNDLVGSAVTDAEGRFKIEFSGSYFRELFFDRRPDLFFKIFSGQKLVKSTQDSVLWNVRAGLTPVEISVPWDGDRVGDDAFYSVSGTVTSPDRPGVGGLRVEIVDRNVGQDVSLAEAFTDERGRYQASFAASSVRERDKKHPDVQARVYAGETFLAASEVRYNATERETLNVRLPANSTALASEHETLTGALSQYYEGRLSELKETNDRQDISYLANKIGWDARAVALAALADKFSQDQAASTDEAGKDKIAPAFYYALFRAGLPANPDTLYQAAPQTVERIWNQAIKQGVIPEATKQNLAGAVEAFRRMSTQKLLTGPPLIGASSMKDLLAVSGLDEARQKKFAELYTTHRTNLPKFWEAVEEAFDAGTAKGLQLNGKLSFLTINNAPLVEQLRNLPGDNPLSKPVELVQRGFYSAKRWGELLDDNIPVPKEIPGDTPKEKRSNYADYLAAQVRLSYPTAAVAEMVKSDYLKVNAPEQVSGFLTEHHGKFEIGMQPVQQYIARNKLNVPEETVKEVKRLQRVYQITPNDRAMAGLLKSEIKIDSAYDILRYEKQAFVRNFGEALGAPENAAQTYDKSLEIYNTLLNLTVSYLTAKNGITLGAHQFQDRPERKLKEGMILRPGPKGRAAENADDVIAYATLEGLFGEMDFCACDHCRSILSPAAYLVDLLFFIDKPEEGDKNPLTVLLKRRPDIQHLPLTCENTNTALPYIDVVNEALECFVANTAADTPKLSLEGYVGHDTNGVSSEDLLASPQFVIDSAYKTLQTKHFPPPLPFHQPLENLRRYFDKFEVPLPLAMERLRKDNALERGANSYAWRDILMEELGLSRPEYEILTDSNAVPLWRMYGFPDGTLDEAIIAELSNAKRFTRRVGITYEEIAAILKTRFINPNSYLIPKLERLGVSFALLDALKRNVPNAEAEFDAELPQGAGAPDPANYDGDIKAWVRKQDNFDRIMRIITLTNTTDDDDPCNFDALEFRYSKPMADINDKSTRLEAVEFVRLMRFIRLWKKLGWTIEQTDAAICALFPGPPFPLDEGAVNTVAKLNDGFLVLLLKLGVVLRVMRALNLSPKRDLLSLLACWSPLGTHGDAALYQQMFLNPAMLARDAAFADNGYGEFLQDNSQKILDHAETLRAAFGLTEDEFSQIITALADAILVAVPYIHPHPVLEQAILDAAPAIAYEPITKRLSYKGALSDETRDRLKTLAGVSAAFQAAVDTLFMANQAVQTRLTLNRISAIYRRGWLARKMKLSVREFLLLTRMTGLNPFAPPDPTNPAILRLIELAQAMKEQLLKSEAALYLVWNQDLSGKSAPDGAQLTEFARSLRSDFAAIEEQFAAIEDPGGEVARARMAQVYGTEATDAFFALIDETLVLDVPYTHTQPVLEKAITDVDALIAYDDFRHRLSHIGLLDENKRDELKNVSGVSAEFQAAVDALFVRSEDTRGSFFGRYSKLEPLFTEIRTPDPPLVLVVDYTHPAANLEAEIRVAAPRIAYDDNAHKLSYSGVLTPARRDILKAVPDVAPAFIAALDALFARSQEAKGKVLAKLQPELSRRRKRQQALQRLSAAAATDLNFTQALLDPPAAPYPLHADGQDDRPVLDDVLALETPGLAVQFFFNDTATSPVDPNVEAAPNMDYAVGGGNPLPTNPTPGAVISGIWRGKVETPEAGFYNFIIEADTGAEVTLSLGGQGRPLLSNGNIWRNAGALELQGGTLYEFVLTVKKVRDRLSVKWETPKRAREVIKGRYLYPPWIFPPFIAAYTRFLKAASLAQALRLTAGELSHFATNADYQINGDGWLNALAVSGDPSPPVAAALLKPLRDLLDFARIKAAISPADESLLKVLQNPTAATVTTDGLLYTLTRWDRTSLADLLAYFGGDLAGLAHFDRFRRIADAFALIQKMGISASALIQATTNEPTGDTVRNLQAALRARYEAADWRLLVQPINDQMRALQRDALVAYILHLMRSNTDSEHIDTAEKLFEYFLMDVAMEPCMQTSRIRHALSSVQLFIERCLMNLETGVNASSIHAKRWEWMKRYRVWEANRKVFLYPENWLEPELRDDKSPFFKEIESQLLQSDITEETATVALLNYLSKLEEVAKLEPCGIYHIESTPQTNEIDHVIARSAGASRKYYYRRRDAGWTPWEEIKLEIEDNPVIPVVWNDRLLLFWLKIMKQGPETGQRPPANTPLTSLNTNDLPGDPPIKVKAVLCWSEYYNGKWQMAKTSDVNLPTELGSFPLAGEHAFDRAQLVLRVPELGDTLLVIIDSSDSGRSSFLLYNTHSLPVRKEGKIFRSFMSYDPYRDIITTDNTLSVRYSKYEFASPYGLITKSDEYVLLENDIRDRVVEPHQTLQNPWEAPFFYEDSRHVFFVTTKEAWDLFIDTLDMGIVGDTGDNATFTIPPLVFEEDVRTVPKFPDDDDLVGPDYGLVNPNPMKRLVMEDANIRQGIGATGSVRYNGSRVGPSGMIPDTSGNQ